MTYKYTLVLIVVIGIHTWMYVVPLSAEESDWSKRFEGQRQVMMTEIFNELNLTAAQQIIIEQKYKDFEKRQTELKEMIRKKRFELREVLEKDETNEVKIDAITDELIELIGQRIKNRAEGVLTVKKILSREQFRVFQKKKQELRKQFWLKKRLQ